MSFGGIKMLEKFKTLKFHSLPTTPHCVMPDRGYKDLSLDDPAIAVMTDHRIESAPLINPDRSLDRAMRQMAEDNCNMLLINDGDEGIAGLLTSADIAGEKPILYIKESGKKRSELKVKYLMTRIEDIPALTIQDVLDSKIGDILHTLNEIGSEHVLVTMEENGKTAIRGVFSARSIARSLKIFFDPSPAARTFAEFTKALHGSEMTH
jgi:CBS-domain-containing membrane protein